jgi:transposase
VVRDYGHAKGGRARRSLGIAGGIDRSCERWYRSSTQMKPRRPARSRSVPAEPQILLRLEDDRAQESAPRPALDPGRVLFKEPDPTELFVGNTRLDRYLVEAGLGEALVIAELLSSLDCWAAFEASYRPGGRAPHHPRRLVGLMLLGLMEGKTSLRALEQLARADVRAWWVTGGLWPDHSTIGKFVQRNSAVLTEELFEELTRKVISRTGSGASRLAGDGTVIEAVSSRLHLIKQEAAEQAAAEARAAAEAAPEDEQLQRKAQLAEEVAQAARERSEDRREKGRANPEAAVSPNEPEAVVQLQKNKTTRPSYKASVVVNEDRIITGQGVDPTNEAKMVGPMVEQSERVTGEKVDELLLDAGYFSAVVVWLCYSADISLLCPQGSSRSGEAKPKESEKLLPKNRFRYDEESDEYICPKGERLRPTQRCSHDRRTGPYVRYMCDACGACPDKALCARGEGGRSIRRYQHEELLEAMLVVMTHPRAQRVYRNRQWMVEPVFAELRYIQGLVRFRRRGLAGVRVEFALHATAHNVRRYIRLTARVEDGSGAAAGGVGASGSVLSVLWCLRKLLEAFVAHGSPSTLLVNVTWSSWQSCSS